MKEIRCTDYSVYFGKLPRVFLAEYVAEQAFSSVVLIADENTYKHGIHSLKAVDFSVPLHIFAFPAGERFKNIDTCMDAWRFMSDKHIDRRALVINLGGGTVTDLGGFVASTFQRGIKYLNIPTSLLAMVDASVGGKTGVDLKGLKNQIGVINNPEMVFIDIQFLKTLPRNEFHSGVAEILKHGLIASREYWQQVSTKAIDLNDNLEEIIYESVAIKNKIVCQDKQEEGIRKHLNFGHTLGHAIESYSLIKPETLSVTHGHAVAIGMVLAGFLSEKLLGFSQKDLQGMITNLIRYYSMVYFTPEDIEQIIPLLQFDKKSRNGTSQFVLLHEVGVPKIDCKIPNDLIYDAFAWYNKITV